jgi:hypothetical protein
MTSKLTIIKYKGKQVVVMVVLVVVVVAAVAVLGLVVVVAMRCHNIFSAKY